MKQFTTLLLLILFSCNNKKTVTKKTETLHKQISVNKRKKTIDDYMSDTSYIPWTAHHPDTTQLMCVIMFHKEFADYWYHGQCQYSYFTYKTSDSTIDLLWSYKSDCILDMSFLESNNGSKPIQNMATPSQPIF